jgi:predicted nucleotidyltransferase
MIVAGIVAEYNPLHNGHLYHINMTRQITNADYVVCVMSGNFVQRGEAAITNKWFRSRMALAAGIDLVIELPAVYAVQSAEQFAFGAIKLLDSIGVVDYLCFGSESGDISALTSAADVLYDEPYALQQAIKQHLANGLSYPHAVSEALSSYAHLSIKLTPNNTLAIEYLKALKELGSSIKPVTIQRLRSSYNSTVLEGEISSATSIRRAIFENGPEYDGVRNAIPNFAYSILSDAFAKGYGPVSLDSIGLIIVYALRNMPKQFLEDVLDISEGLEHRIKKAAMLAGDLQTLINSIKTKRYTQTRIQRAIIHAMLGMSNDVMDELTSNGGPQYIRVLGFSEKGKQLLPYISSKSSLPLLSKAADYGSILSPPGRKLFEIEIKATDLYSLAYMKPALRRAGNEFVNDIYHIW